MWSSSTIWFLPEIVFFDVANSWKQEKRNRIPAAKRVWSVHKTVRKKFDEAYEQGIIHGILTTNLIYRHRIIEQPYYINRDLSKCISHWLSTLNFTTVPSAVFKSERASSECVKNKSQWRKDLMGNRYRYIERCPRDTLVFFKNHTSYNRKPQLHQYMSAQKCSHKISKFLHPFFFSSKRYHLSPSPYPLLSSTSA